jgi:hypothetical protein
MDNNLYQGSSLSKVFGFISIVLALSGVFFLVFIHQWLLGIVLIIFSIITAYIGYRFSGGRINPSLWEDKDVYDLIREGLRINNGCKISIHESDDLNPILARLEAFGIKKKNLSLDDRPFIKYQIINNRKAFDACRDYIVICAYNNGKEYEGIYWDGHGNIRSAQFIHEAKVIFELFNSSAIDFFIKILGDSQAQKF